MITEMGKLATPRGPVAMAVVATLMIFAAACSKTPAMKSDGGAAKAQASMASGHENPGQRSQLEDAASGGMPSPTLGEGANAAEAAAANSQPGLDAVPGELPTVWEMPQGAVALGKPVTQPQSLRLAEIQNNFTPYLQKTVLLEATAEKICQAKGCWMTVVDGEGAPIWVRWASGCGGEFAFPKDAAGKRMVVEGTLAEKEISAEDAEHIAGESPGMDAAKIAGKTFEINATACVVLPDPKKQS